MCEPYEAGNSASFGVVVARRGTAGGSAAPVEALCLLFTSTSPPNSNNLLLHLTVRPPGGFWKLAVCQAENGSMDKLKRVLSGQDNGNSDGSGIMEVNGS